MAEVADTTQEDEMKPNRLKRRIVDGETVIGTFCLIPNATVVEAIATAGIDFVVLDTEHGPLSLETCENLIRAAECGGATPIIRVQANRSELILRVLDIGAGGVQVPQIECAEDARATVHSAKYAPMGQRGLAVCTRAGQYVGVPDHTESSNAEQMVIVHIEGIQAVDHLDEILEVDGIDVIFLGPYDMSQSLGIPGQVDDPLVKRTLQKCAARARDAGRAVGSYAKDNAYAHWLESIGVQ